MRMANCLVRQIHDLPGPYLGVVDMGRLAIRLLDVRIVSIRRIKMFRLRYPILKSLNGGGWPGRPGGQIGREDRKSTRLNSSHSGESRMPSSA